MDNFLDFDKKNGLTSGIYTTKLIGTSDDGKQKVVSGKIVVN